MMLRLKRVVVLCLIAVFMAVSLVFTVGCGGEETKDPGKDNQQNEQTDDTGKPDKDNEEDKEVDEGPLLPEWIEKTDGAQVKLAGGSQVLSASDLVQVHTKPSYKTNADGTEVQYQSTTLSLQLDKDSTQDFKDGAYIDLIISNADGAVYDDVNDIAMGNFSTLRFYFYEKYSAFYFVFFNDNQGMLMWFPSDGTSATYTQLAKDFIEGRKIYINYQFKDILESVEDELVFKQEEFYLYCGVDNGQGGVTWLKDGPLYYPGQNCWVYDDEGNVNGESETSICGHKMVTTQYVRFGYRQKDCYVFVGGGEKATFKVTVGDVKFSDETVKAQATQATLPAWEK